MRAGQDAMKQFDDALVAVREWEPRIIARRAVNSFPLCCLPFSGRHIGIQQSLVDEDKTARTDPALMRLPATALSGTVRPILHCRHDCFLKLSPSVLRCGIPSISQDPCSM
jgi:hypothetical protein